MVIIIVVVVVVSAVGANGPKDVGIARGGGVPREGVVKELDGIVARVVDGAALALTSDARGPGGVCGSGTAGAARSAAGPGAVGPRCAGRSRSAGRPAGAAIGLVGGEGSPGHLGVLTVAEESATGAV